MIAQRLHPDEPLMAAVRAIEASGRRIAAVADAEGKLLGTLTDGDIRRCLLRGGSLATPVAEAMNRAPLTAPFGSPSGYLLDLMHRGNVLAIPLVDEAGCFEGFRHLSDLSPGSEEGGPVAFDFAVIMAGGQGMRLRPITEKIPKPMVDIAGVPLLERQVRRLADVGITKLYFSVNHLSHVIEEHFGDGSALGVNISYLREQERRGTAGALSLLPATPTGPILVMNGDILTGSDFGALLRFHQTHFAHITVAAVDHRVDIPFGVIQAEGAYVKGFAEKPSQRFLCNAGIYAVSPEALGLVPSAGVFNMTDLIKNAIAVNRSVAVFPVHEYWSDVGTPADLEQARKFYAATPTH